MSEIYFTTGAKGGDVRNHVPDLRPHVLLLGIKKEEHR